MQKPRMDPMISSIDSNEYVNAISHLIGAILSISALVILVTLAVQHQNWTNVISFSIYGISMLLSFIASCLLHFFLLFGIYKRVFGILDHCAIYLLIAGTYTPFCLTIFDGVMGWVLFGLIWSLAIFFIVIKAVFFTKLSMLLSNGSYLLMGWLVVFFLFPIYTRLGLSAIALMTIGGLFYTVGAIIFARGIPNPWPPYFGNHEIWHVAVLLGNIMFFVVLLLFIVPA
ncbi:MAG: hemolysin III family protein [Roseiflexaceae bacterium]|nr:hemolysin III family protein [Roseiflexaceae bacterium]